LKIAGKKFREKIRALVGGGDDYILENLEERDDREKQISGRRKDQFVY